MKKHALTFQFQFITKQQKDYCSHLRQVSQNQECSMSKDSICNPTTRKMQVNLLQYKHVAFKLEYLQQKSIF